MSGLNDAAVRSQVPRGNEPIPPGQPAIDVIDRATTERLSLGKWAAALGMAEFWAVIIYSACTFSGAVDLARKTEDGSSRFLVGQNDLLIVLGARAVVTAAVFAHSLVLLKSSIRLTRPVSLPEEPKDSDDSNTEELQKAIISRLDTLLSRNK